MFRYGCSKTGYRNVLCEATARCTGGTLWGGGKTARSHFFRKRVSGNLSAEISWVREKGASLLVRSTASHLFLLRSSSPVVRGFTLLSVAGPARVMGCEIVVGLGKSVKWPYLAKGAMMMMMMMLERLATLECLLLPSWIWVGAASRSSRACVTKRLL